MQPVRPEDFTDLISAKSPTSIPSRGTVVYTRQQVKSETKYLANLIAVDLESGTSRSITDSPHHDSGPSWDENTEQLAFIRGDEELDRPQLHLVSLDGGEPTKLTHVIGGVDDFVWAPDGSTIAFSQKVTMDDQTNGLDLIVEDESAFDNEAPDPRVVDRLKYRTGTSYLDGRRSHIYVVEVETGDVERITDGEKDFTNPEWGDSDTLYFAADDSDRDISYEIQRYSMTAGEISTIAESNAWSRHLAATEDGRVVYPYIPGDRGIMYLTELRLFDEHDGSDILLTDHVDRRIRTRIGLDWGPNQEHVYICIPHEGTHELLRINPKDPKEIDVVLDGDRHLFEFSIDEDRISLIQSQWDYPNDLFTMGVDEQTPIRLTNNNEEYLEGVTVSEPTEMWYESTNGSVHGYYLVPDNFDPEEEYPVIVNIHGGPYGMWTKSGTMWHEFQLLAANGYVVFWCNPRGSVGYGQEFTEAIKDNVGEVTFTDIMAGVDELAAKPFIDEGNLFVTGGSFGGFMTAWTVCNTDRMRAAVAQRGVYDKVVYYGTGDAQMSVEWDFGTDPWNDPDLLHDNSPTYLADRVTTPTMLIHSESDYRTPICMAEMFFKFLKLNDVETRLVRYPREGHELSRSGEPKHVIDRLERILRWFDGYSDHHDVDPVLSAGE